MIEMTAILQARFIAALYRNADRFYAWRRSPDDNANRSTSLRDLSAHRKNRGTKLPSQNTSQETGTVSTPVKQAKERR